MLDSKKPIFFKDGLGVGKYDEVKVPLMGAQRDISRAINLFRTNIEC